MGSKNLVEQYYYYSILEYAFAQHNIVAEFDNSACRKFFPFDKYDAVPIPNEQELNDMCP